MPFSLKEIMSPNDSKFAQKKKKMSIRKLYTAKFIFDFKATSPIIHFEILFIYSILRENSKKIGSFKFNSPSL